MKISQGHVPALFFRTILLPEYADAESVKSARLKHEAEHQFHLQTRRQKALDHQLMPPLPDARLSFQGGVSSGGILSDAPPGFMIEQPVLPARNVNTQVSCQRLTDQVAGHCLGIEGINRLVTGIQNRSILRG